ncbi:phage minor head protein [Shewanella algae]|uniref:phage head morphogenesis protein n=1 Tax=Shewanella algae TaxID=38313 RepID=UPI0031F4F73F
MSESIIPKESLAWLRAKRLTPGFDYRDVWREEHNSAFTVAKMMQLDLLADTKAALDDALEQGLTFRQFARRLKPELIKAGWWGKSVMVDPMDGSEKPVQLGSDNRLKTIYRTNMRTARAAGQWQRIERNKALLPYLVYELGPSREHRELHLKWANLVLPVDSPFWDTHRPPNGWGCNCRVRQVSQDEFLRLKQAGAMTEAPEIDYRSVVNRRTGETMQVPRGIDPGWDYNPGARPPRNSQLLRKAIGAPPSEAATILRDVLSLPTPRQEIGLAFSSVVKEISADISRAKARGLTWHIGSLSPEVVSTMAKQGLTPASAVISIQDRDLIHMLRDAKGKRKTAIGELDKRLPEDFIQSLPERLHSPMAILQDLQQADPTLLYVYDLGSTSGKLVIKMDYQIKVNREKIKTNLVRSGEVLLDTTTLGSSLYRTIWGRVD